MSELLSLLHAAVAKTSRDQHVAVLLSGGLDSLSVGIALQKSGKTISAYTYDVEGYPSLDRSKAEGIARHFGWPLTVITIPRDRVADDFIRLAVQYHCRKKTQFEVAFPLLYIFPQIEEAEIWSGWNADDHYGNTKKLMLRYARMAREKVSHAELKADFDEYRQDLFRDLDDPESEDTWWFAKRVAAGNGKTLLDPYLNGDIRQYFLQFDHRTLSSLSKPLVREALAGELGRMQKGSIAVGVQMQIGGGVNSLFETLLSDPRINRFDRKYMRVSDLCRRWAKEVSAYPTTFQKELASLPSPLMSRTRVISGGTYHTYTMTDVRAASAASRFSVVSMFSGGGGSSIGYRLAGGNVLLASEFVPEAARTYETNFPGTVVDRREIRQVIGEPGGVERFIAAVGLKPGELDVLDGSPPCSEFSRVGRGIGDQLVMRPYSDLAQRGIAGLIFEFARVAHGAQPKVVVGENVPELGTTYREVFDRAMSALCFPNGPHAARAYFAASKVLVASEFGVAQKRRRLFFIAVRADVAGAVGITSNDDVLQHFPKPSHAPSSVQVALHDLHQTNFDFRAWRRSAITTSLDQLVRRITKNPPAWWRLSDDEPGNESHYTLKRAAWHLPAPTLTATGQQPDGMDGIIHPSEDRKFTLPELRRLFALPDDFVLTGTLSQAAERICRMVPPPLTRAIAESVYERVLGPYAEDRA